MRSRVDSALRAVVLALLLWRLVLAIVGSPDRGVEVAGSSALPAALARWTTVVAPARVHASLSHPPTQGERDWLASLPGAGTAVTWTGSNFPATALGVLPVADPAGGADVLIAAPAGSLPVVGDAAARADTVERQGAVTRLHLPRVESEVLAGVGAALAREALRDSLEYRRLLVLGSAGWETKFVIAALEERGWTVDAHIAVAPGGDIAQGAQVRRSSAASPASAGVAPGAMGMPGAGFRAARGAAGTSAFMPGVPTPAEAPAPGAKARAARLTAIDTARYSAVIAVDSTAGREAARIARFVRSGGGLVLTAAAADAAGLRSLAPARPEPLVDEAHERTGQAVTRETLQVRALLDLRPDAVVIERREGRVVAAARREGLGRVVLTGEVDLWRWRMGGGDGSAEAHRTWLARLVAGAARTVRHPREAPTLDPAPLAALIDRLGPPLPAGPPISGPGRDPLRAWVFAALCAALLLEWLWRRLHSRP